MDMKNFEKKLRKLRRNPGKFFDDFLRRKAGRLADLGRASLPSLPKARIASGRRYTVVSAMYGAEPYLDDFFKSLTRQTLDFKTSIQLVMVDDGSTDRSAEIVAKWRRIHPANIKYIHKQNGGQASARNLGLQHASGEWVTFIDPDDFVAHDYFEKVEDALASASEPIAMVACKLVFYHEKNGRYTDRHPLRSLFFDYPKTVNLRTSKKHIQLSASSAFFRKQVITDNALAFDGRIRPSFEDAHFVSRYVSHTLDDSAAFLGNAKYFYRKRKTENSSIDTSWAKKEQYQAVLEYGVLDMLQYYLKHHGSIPLPIQRTALYQVIWYIKTLLNKPTLPAKLSQEEHEKFLALLQQIFDHIDTATILSFDLAGVWFYHRVGLMSVYKNKTLPFQIVYASGYDEERRLFQLQYFAAAPGFEAFYIDATEVMPLFETTRSHSFAGIPFVVERTVWLPLAAHGTLTVKLAGYATRLSLDSRQQKKLALADIHHHFKNAKSRPCDAGPLARTIKHLARLKPVRRAFSGAWALMDRNTQADDNAEHLYRHIVKTRPDINAFFILDRDSHDWPRLKAEGYRLVAFGGLRHKLLLLNCDHLVTSHIDAHIIHALPQASYRDRLKFKLTFLQHGVIINDLSHWLNVKNPSLLVTSGKQEWQALSGPGNYKFSGREVRLTGLPRHDGLFNCGEAEKCILIMPTWRQSLVGPIIPGTGRRALNPRFVDSDYFQAWSALLRDELFLSLHTERGYRTVFFPHANMQPYLEFFNFPSHIEVLRHVDNGMQELFRAGAVIITDYSSVACEFGFMQKPVVYFQFDRKTLLNGGHLCQFLDYSETGFGPVRENPDDVVAVLRDIVDRGCTMDETYRARSDDFFGFRDARNCERVVEEILALDVPVLATEADASLLLKRAEQAYDAAAWDAVIRRCTVTEAHPRLSPGDRRRSLLLREYACLALRETPFAAAPSGCATQTSSPTARRWQQLLEKLRDHPDLANLVRQRLFSARLDIGDYTGACSAAAATVDADPKPFAEQARFAALAVAHEDMRAAQRHLETLLKTPRPDVGTAFPGAQDLWFALASLHANQGDHFKARGLLMQSLRRAPRDARCASRLGALLDSREASDCLEQRRHASRSRIFCDDIGFAAGSSQTIDVAICLAIEARLGNDHAVATETIAGLLCSHPYDPFVRMEAGELSLTVGRWEEAEEHFARAWTAVWSRYVPRIARGLLLSRQHLHRHVDCANVADVALRAYPADYRIAQACTTIALREARWHDAEAGSRRALELCSRVGTQQRIQAEKLRIATLCATGRDNEALGRLATLVRFKMIDQDLLTKYAALSGERGQWHVAAEMWKRLEEAQTSPAEKSAMARRRAHAHWCAGDRGNARRILANELESEIFAGLARGDGRELLQRVGKIRETLLDNRLRTMTDCHDAGLRR